MNWGFIGYGRIAVKFMESLKLVKGEVPYALASRSNAEQLRSQFLELKVYDSYDGLLNDPNVDIVYVNTTHNFHKENVIDALKKGKHVLCEKPMGLNVAEVDEMVAMAKIQGKFLMEGLWTRFLPGYQKVKEVVTSGEIGEVTLIRSEFAFTDVTHKERLYNPALAGGSNYDVNIYNLALVHDFLGNEQPEIKIQARTSESGTDLSCSSILQFSDNSMAQLFSSIEMSCENAAWLYGTKGWIRMEHFWKCEKFEIQSENGKRSVELPFTGNGFYHEIEEVVNCINGGLHESLLMSHAHSRELIKLVDTTEQLIRNLKKP